MGGGRPPPPLQSLICAPIVPHPATYADCKPDRSGVAWATACVRLVRDDGACLDGLEAGGGDRPTLRQRHYLLNPAPIHRLPKLRVAARSARRRGWIWGGGSGVF